MNEKQAVRAARRMIDNLMTVEGEIRDKHPDVEVWMDRLVIKGMKGRLMRGFAKLRITPETFYDAMSEIMGRETGFTGIPPVSVDQAFYVHTTLSWV